MGQGGLWDVDGTGMKEIEDPELARKMRDKVNAFNAQKAREIAVPALLFTFFPFKTAKRALGRLFL